MRGFQQLRSALLFASLLPVCACSAGWHRIEPVAPSNLPKGQQVQMWQGRERLQLHAIRVDHDSISGVPIQKPADCESCRISVPSASIDSLSAGNPTAAFFKSIGLALVSWLTLGLAAYRLGL